MSNYNTWLVTTKEFKVRDPESFIEDLEKAEVTEAKGDFLGLHYEQEDDGRFWLGGYNADLVVYLDDGAGSVTGVDVAEIVREHIRKDQTAVFKIVGQEKLRFVSGAVVVVKWFGIKSETLDKMALKLKERMGPLKQGVKEALLSSS